MFDRHVKKILIKEDSSSLAPEMTNFELILFLFTLNMTFVGFHIFPQLKLKYHLSKFKRGKKVKKKERN